ncbi:MAG: MmgE/PrpD family protein [Tistlia sp.]|uniref:MmgE/PrpD family protein n=1 Tax=Tistlia sp. TaxID=3057121 RepID=UPI0034A56B32
MSRVPARQEGATDLGRRLTRNALAVDGAALDAERLARLKLCLLDLLSCVLGAGPMPWNAPLLAYAARACGQGRAAILGTSHRCAPAEAAFVNSALGAGASRSDMHPPSASHPGLVIFPTLLALASEEEIDGREFLLAALAGYEAMGRTGRALVTSDNSRRFRPSGLCGPVGSALAAARALDLGEERALSALGIAGNAAGGLMEWAFSGAPDLCYQPAQAARAGTVAALLAREGARGSHSILEGPAGLLATFGGPPERAGLLGEPWGGAFEIDAVEFKSVPICVFAQAAAFAAKQLVDGQGPDLDAEAIEAVEVATFGKALDYPGCAAGGPIATPQEARMSIPFSVASVLVLRDLGDANFAAVGDPRIARLAAAVELRGDEAMDAAFPGRQQARVAVRLAGGQRVESFLPALPVFGPAQVRERFRRCASGVLGETKARVLEDAVEDLEGLARVSPLLGLLRPC